MEYRLLGPIEILDGDRVVALGGRRQRTLLAALLLGAGRAVPMHRLQDALWGDDPPKTATTQIHGLVSQLRRAIWPDDPAGGALRTGPSGYLLEVGEGQLDVRAFDDLVAAAREAGAAGRRADAAEKLRAALRLWRGGPLGGIESTALAGAELPALQERWPAALEERISADLALGRHADLVGELRGLVGEYPFRERLRGQLMLALYRSDRQPEALQVYREGRSVLVAELGLEPGPRLRDLEQAMLAGDPVLDLVADREASAVPLPVPAQLPADIADFTGRAKPLGQLVDLFTGEDRHSAAVRICAVAGKPGVGKTTLAVHAAHRVRRSFPDGQLYVNLRGAHAEPLPPGEVLRRFLRALGVDGAGLPEDDDAKSELYRSLLAGKRMLVVLDNAVSESQVRPLLPGTAPSAVLVTSRARLSGVDGARQLELDILEEEQAIELVANAVGRDRVAAEAAAAERLAALCGYLPLALRVAGAKLAARPHWTLARLVDRLGDERGRLDELSVADIEVRASLAETYAGLGPAAARLMRLLGLIDPPDFAAWVPAALGDHPPRLAEELLEDLVAAQLLDVVGADATGQLRYRMHDLTRVYAHEVAEATESPAQRAAALDRWGGAWLTLADAALVRTPTGIPRPRHGDAPRWPVGERLTAELLADPMAWFRAEHASALAAIDQLNAHGLHEAAWDLAGSVCSAPLLVGGLYEDWGRIADAGLLTVRAAGNRRGEAVLLCVRSLLDYSQERYEAAAEQAAEARRIFAAIGDTQGAGVGSYGLGATLHRLGRADDAAATLTDALRTFERAGDVAALACARRHLGSLHYEQGRHDEALRTLLLALPESVQAGDERCEGYVRYWIGLIQQDRAAPVTDTADPADGGTAEDWLNRALHLLRGVGDRLGEALCTRELAALDIAAGRTAMATVRLENCGAVFRQLRNVLGRTLTTVTLAELRARQGQPQHAVTLLREAERDWARLHAPARRVAALRRIAELLAAAGDPDGATDAAAEADALLAPPATLPEPPEPPAPAESPDLRESAKNPRDSDFVAER